METGNMLPSCLLVVKMMSCHKMLLIRAYQLPRDLAFQDSQIKLVREATWSVNKEMSNKYVKLVTQHYAYRESSKITCSRSLNWTMQPLLEVM